MNQNLIPKHKIMNQKALNVLIFLLVLTIKIYGQAPTYPFPQNRNYGYGFMQNVSPRTTASTLAQTWYTDWLTSYYVDCSPTQARIVEGSTTYSEGIGYGMLITAYAGDKARFDKLWAYYKANRNANGLMHWCRTNCSNPAGGCGDNGATDGDLDAAMALLVANCQWPSTTAPHNYTTDAQALISAIRDDETFASCSGLRVLRPGDAFNIGGACNCLNISYFAPGYYRAFAEFMPADAALWTKLADDSYTIINSNANATTGLVSAWTRANGSIPSNAGGAPDFCNYAVSGGGSASDYQFDAARTPWRIATDYLWYGTPAADTWLTRVSNWANGVGVANIVAGYTGAGNPLVSFKNSAFTGAFALAAMANSQTMTNTFYSWWSSNSVTSGAVGTRLDDGPYFQRSLRVLYMLLATGNFWWPCSTGPTCGGPNISPRPNTICGTSDPLTLNAGIAPISSPLRRRLQWFRNGASISGANSQTFNIYSLPAGQRTGTFTVRVDSLDNVGALVCSSRDSVSLSGTIPAINLGANRNLCSPAYTSLSTSISGLGITYQWASTTVSGSGAFSSLTDIASATGSTLNNIRTRGLYQIKVSASGCATVMDTVTISSNVPSPRDGCINSSGSLNIGIQNPGLGTGPYNWYTSETGSTLAPGASTNTTSYTTPTIGSTTTYWVQDMSAVSGTVGPTTYLNGTQQWGVSAGNRLIFNASTAFTLNAVTIPFEIYGGSTGAVTIAIQNNSGTVLTSATSQNVTASAGSVVMLEFTFTGFNIPSGTGLQMVLTSVGSLNGNPLWNDNVTTSYPYNATPSNIVSITGSVGGNSNPEYMYFYNWKFSSGAACGRVPVVAQIGGCGYTVLNLNWINFDLTQDKKSNKLEWSCSFESTEGRFIVQRSFDGVNFSDISSIAANKDENSRIYKYEDEITSSNYEAYYRIVYILPNMETSYSSVLRASNNPYLDFTIYPNPSTGNEFYIEFPYINNQLMTVQIFDNLGIEVHNNTFEPNGNTSLISLKNALTSGIYYVSIKKSNKSSYKKLIVH